MSPSQPDRLAAAPDVTTGAEHAERTDSAHTGRRADPSAATEPAGPQSPGEARSAAPTAQERGGATRATFPPSPYAKSGQADAPRVDRTARPQPPNDALDDARTDSPADAGTHARTDPGTHAATGAGEAVDGAHGPAAHAGTSPVAGSAARPNALAGDGVRVVPPRRVRDEDGAGRSLAKPRYLDHTADPDWDPPEDPPMIRRREPRPRMGWRGFVYETTGGRWNPGQSVKEQRIRERERQISRQLRGKHVTAFFCLKGGISKTSTTAATSIAMANLRPDPVFAIDANPDAGDLAERLVGQSRAGITELSAGIDRIDSLDALSRYTLTAGRLTMLPGEPNPELGDSLSSEDFRRIMGVVQRYYNVVQVDCGTGVTHPLMRGILEFADTVVIPASWSITGARRAAETILWLETHGFERLARTSIVVLTAKDLVSRSVDKEAVRSYLSQAADLIVVPSDPHVADGALIDWEQLGPATKEAYLDIAASITKRFPDGGWPVAP